jgi:hypothetical protein
MSCERMTYTFTFISDMDIFISYWLANEQTDTKGKQIKHLKRDFGKHSKHKHPM